MKDKHNKKGIVTAEYVRDNMLNTTIPSMSKGIQPFAAANTSGLLASLQALNPLQHIATSIAQICHYKQQVKALETEQLRIKQQAQVMHHQIDAQLEIRIKELDEQGQHLRLSLQLVAETLEVQRLDRSELREAYQKFTSAMIDKTLSYEEKCLSHEGLQITAAALKESGYAGMQVLLASITTTQQALAQPGLKALLRSPEPQED